MQALVRRLEEGVDLRCDGVPRGVQAFLAVLLQRWFPRKTVVVVTDGLKSQESVHQDIATWRSLAAAARPGAKSRSRPSATVPPLFFPAWDVLPDEGRLPHVDVISERLETLAAFCNPGDAPNRCGPSAGSGRVLTRAAGPGSARGAGARPEGASAPLVVTSVAALLQRTFAPQSMVQRLRIVRRGDALDPLDLIEWLETQGYEPEAQVNHKGQIALRGGILDIFSPTSPWPVRLEFFGNAVESLRAFDPITQISREPVDEALVGPAGELGVLKQALALHPNTPSGPLPAGSQAALATLIEYVPPGTLWLMCEPESLAAAAGGHAARVSGQDVFHVSWEDFQAALARRRMTRLDLREQDPPAVAAGDGAGLALAFSSLEGFRPVADRTEAAVVIEARRREHLEAQRREFFEQLHRWMRQGHAVHVVCNNEGERQRFVEIWDEYGLGRGGSPVAASNSPEPASGGQRPGGGAPEAAGGGAGWRAAGGGGVWTHLGALTEGFLNAAAKVV
ncbi:MAG: hypothetical protein JXQ71_04980, partial [Verrucomicrobia bacterium]|nr:hypothetical protein [Verrucomicrobiota bacterium]